MLWSNLYQIIQNKTMNTEENTTAPVVADETPTSSEEVVGAPEGAASPVEVDEAPAI